MASMPRSGRYSTTRGPTPACAAAAVLTLSASRSMPEQPGVALRAAHDDVQRVAVVGGRDPDVVVGQPARQVGDTPGPPRQDGEAVQVDLWRQCLGSSKASMTAGSMVIFGPVNHFLADRCHQMATSRIVPPVRIGA